MGSRITALEKKIYNLESVFAVAIRRKKHDKYSQLAAENKKVDDSDFKKWKKDNDEKYLELDKIFDDYQKHLQNDGSVPEPKIEIVME